MKKLFVLGLFTLTSVAFANEDISICDLNYESQLDKIGCKKILSKDYLGAMEAWKAMQALNRTCVDTYDKGYDKGFKNGFGAGLSRGNSETSDLGYDENYEIGWFNGYYGTKFECSK